MRLLASTLLFFGAILGVGYPGISAGAPAEGLVWSYQTDEVKRWYIENEVHLPYFIWFVAERNRQVRVAAFQTRLVVNCDSFTPVNRRAFDMECVLEDVSLRAAAVRGDEGRLKEILDEMSGDMKALTLQVRLRPNGRLVSLSLLDTGDRGVFNRRVNVKRENMRLILYRALAGLDLELPRHGATEAGYWPQYESALLMTPSTKGTRAAAELVHRIGNRDGDQTAIHTSGRGTLSPGGDDFNFYTSHIEGVTVFNRTLGHVSERTWMAISKPRASSAMADGTPGLPYIQRGLIRELAPGKTEAVGVSGEVERPGVTQGVHHLWQSIGAKVD